MRCGTNHSVTLRSKAHLRKGKSLRLDNGNIGIWTGLGHPPLSSSCLNKVLDKVVSMMSLPIAIILCLYSMKASIQLQQASLLLCGQKWFDPLCCKSACIHHKPRHFPHTLDTFKGNLLKDSLLSFTVESLVILKILNSRYLNQYSFNKSGRAPSFHNTSWRACCRRTFRKGKIS